MRNLRNKLNWLTLLLTLAALPVGVYLVQNVGSIFLRARGQPANLVINLANTSPQSPDLWKNFAQGGESDHAGLPAIVSQISELKPNYIRIDHLFDRYQTVQLQNGQLIFSWQALDSEVDAILAAGAKPYLSLSYFPPSITSGSSIDLPVNWGHWQEIVRQTVEHFSSRNGRAIPDVYYEVWNEPDLFGGFKTYGPKNYLELYKYSAQGARSAGNALSFKIGGPATTGAYPNWFKDLLSFASSNNLPLDFLSWHRYSSDLDDYETDLATASDAISQFPQYSNIELIISEIGPNSENDAVYDGSIGAIHSLASISMLDQRVSKAFSFEIQDGKGPEKFWGRWGLLTHADFPPVQKKTRFMAFQLLNTLSGQPIPVEGQGSWVKAMARVDGTTIKILASNFDAEGKHFETVPIRIANLENGNWVYTRRDFLGKTNTLPITVQEGAYEVLELFPPNSAAILELERVRQL